jgi:hypothetical protein
VWWVTIVDATLVRHHLQAYDDVLASHVPAERQRIEDTLAGLRFVRNRIGGQANLEDFIEPPGATPDACKAPITAWTWQKGRQSALTSLPPAGQHWEMTRYAAYQAQLAAHTTGETFDRATTFLTLTTTKPGHQIAIRDVHNS